MAIFGRDFFGQTKYGANVHADFDVSPFMANPDGYGSIRVTWHSPAGSWSQLRLLRSRNGYAVNATDGVIVVDSQGPIDRFYDSGLIGGFWYYYTIFVKDSQGNWNRAGATSSLVVKKPWEGQGHADLLWDRIPRYFRYIRRDHVAITDEYVFAPSDGTADIYSPDGYDRENQHLRNFLNVLGWGLDYLHTYQSTLLQANNAKQAHLSDVVRLAGEMGMDFEYGIPAAVMRSKVQNGALLARRRGTIEGLRDAVALSTGWDIDVTQNQNHMLNRDQAEFANPIYPEWSSGTNYAVGQKVQFSGRIVTALQGAYGDAMKPPVSPAMSNAYWTVTTDVDVTTLHNDATNAVITWKGFVDSVTPQTLALATGISSPFDSVGLESNALVVRNSTAAGHTYDVLGASNLKTDTTFVLPKPEYVVRQGIPIPRVLLWDSTVEYALGVLVLYHGASWRAIGTSVNEAPRTGSQFWEKVGIDSRPLMAYSFYAHGPMAGTPGSGGVAVTPGLAFFDGSGNLLSDQVTATVASNFFFDTFNAQALTDWTLRSPDFTWSNQKWLQVSGTWKTGTLGSNNDCVAYPNGTGVTVVSVPSTLTQYRIAATFAKAALPGQTDSVVLRFVDNSNYIRVTRTKVEKRVAGTLSTLATLASPIKTGQRVTVHVNDTAATFTLDVDGVQVASGSLTLAGATAPYKHGMMVD